MAYSGHRQRERPTAREPEAAAARAPEWEPVEAAEEGTLHTLAPVRSNNPSPVQKAKPDISAEVAEPLHYPNRATRGAGHHRISDCPLDVSDGRIGKL